MKFTPLHINTEYSFQESSIRINKLIKKAKDMELTSLSITDHNSMFGVAEFVHKCLKNNIKPIVGLDLDVDNYRLILLAKNFDGYKKLNYLSSKKMSGQDISIDDVLSSDLFVIDHPTKGHFAKTKKQLVMENYFVGLSDGNFANCVFVEEGLTLDDNDIKTLEIVNKINGKEISQNIHSLNFQPNLDLIHVQQAIKIADDCNIVWPKNEKYLPKFPSAKNKKSIDLLKEIVQTNAKVSLSGIKNKGIYIERIKYEVSIIEKLGFEDYFLIIWDLVHWAKENNISIGPGRGSAAGSLIAFLLNITEIDPIKYGLIFERFLNTERISMPDIDIDIQDNKRDKVINYLFDKYGSQKVALISTFSKLGPKSSLRDIARYLEMPVRDINALSKLVSSDISLKESFESNPKFRAVIESSDKYENLYNLSCLIEGLPRQYSTHAAGIVISDTNMNEKAPTIMGLDGHLQIQYSMDHLEKHNLLKIDVLGLRNLTTIKKIQEEVYKNYGKRVDLSKIPDKDEDTNKMLSEGETNGIFQLESFGMKRTLERVGVSNFNDIVAIISLFRPGPMDNIPLYSNRKTGKEKIPFVSEGFDEITKDTYGIIVYQEQIMQIVQRYSGMSFSQADIFRRAIGKKNIDLLTKMKKVFFEGALDKGHEEKQITIIFDLIEKFASYGFNKSHAVAYSLISYRMAYLKSKFKFEFYTALLSSSISSQINTKKYVEEAKRHNIKVIPPDINSSYINVVNINKSIILPLQIIKGLGDSAATKILEERKERGAFKNFFDFIIRSKISGIGEPTIKLLIESNSLRIFGNMQSLSDSLPLALRFSNMISVKDGEITDINDYGIPRPKMIIQSQDISNEIFNEKKSFGFQLNSFKTLEFEGEIKLNNLKIKSPEEIVVLLEKIKKYKISGDKFIYKASVSDSSMSVELTIFDNIYKFIENTKNGTLIKARIEKSIWNNRKTYTLKESWKDIENE